MPTLIKHLSSFLSPSSLFTPQNIIITTTIPLLQFHYLHSNPNHFDITQLSSPKLIHQYSTRIAHATVIKNGSIHHLRVVNGLLNLYIKSTNITFGRQLFDEMPERDVRSWTILISGFSSIESYKLGLELFIQMLKEGISPNQFTLSSVVKCCAGAYELNFGKTILGWILRNEVSLDITLKNSILDLFVKCESFDYATKFLHTTSVIDTVSWNIMIRAYVKNGDMDKAEELFWQLPVKDAASWNTIIDGYLQNGHEEIAVHLLYKMVATGLAFSNVTFSIVLVLASSLKLVKLGKQIHSQILRVGIHDAIIRNSLIDMYCKCGDMEKAMIIFKTSSQLVNSESITDFVFLSSIISGYIQNDRIDDALKVFSFMVSEQGKVDIFTLTSILSACADNGLLNLGQLLHTYILKSGHEPDVFVSSSMIDMYAKCGKLQCAWLVFKEAKTRNVVLWTAVLSSYASHGKGNETIRLFELMRNEGIIPNEVTFVAVLNACSHAGLINEGCNYFMLMKDDYGIKPKVEHYTCMVDLLGRGGRLNEIKDFIFENNILHFSVVWKAFLASCYIHKNVEMANWVSEKLYELDPSAAGAYILMSKTCAVDCKWDEAAKLKAAIQEKGIQKRPGKSWI